MGFSSKPIAERLETMGDLAETVFQQWAETKGLAVEHFGFEGRGLPFRRGMDPRLRKRPDFLCWSDTVPHTFVDPKGTAGGGVKIMQEDIEYKQFWTAFHPVWFFVYDSNAEKFALATVEELAEHSKHAETGRFEDGGKRAPYYRFDPSLFRWQEAPKLPGFGGIFSARE